MSLRVTNLTGSGRRRVINLSVSSSENDYVLYDKLSAAGHAPGTATLGGGRTVVRVVISNTVVIGSTSTSTAGFRTHDGDTYGTGWAAADCQIIVEGTNTGTIQGKGGAGGNAGWSDEGLGGDGGGGGGGGAGTQVGAGGTVADGGGAAGSAGTQSAGGAGGAGSATGGSGVQGAAAGSAGGPALEASSGGPNITLRPATGATLRVWGGGGGGGGSAVNATGGAGGGPGLDGSAGNGAGGAAGGANGNAYSTPGSATITEVGPGTVDDLGT